MTLEQKRTRELILDYVKTNNSFPEKLNSFNFSDDLIIDILSINPNYISRFPIESLSNYVLYNIVAKLPSVYMRKVPEERIDENFVKNVLSLNINVIKYIPDIKLILVKPWELNNLGYDKLTYESYVYLIDTMFSNTVTNAGLREYIEDNPAFYDNMDVEAKRYYILKRLNKRLSLFLFDKLDKEIINEEIVSTAAKRLAPNEFLRLFGQDIFHGEYADVIKSVNQNLYNMYSKKNNLSENDYLNAYNQDNLNILKMPLGYTTKSMWNEVLEKAMSSNNKYHNHLNEILKRMPNRYFDKKTLKNLLYDHTNHIKCLSAKLFNSEMIYEYLVSAEEYYSWYVMPEIIEDVEDIIVEHMNEEIFNFLNKYELFNEAIIEKADIEKYVKLNPGILSKLADVNPNIIKRINDIRLTYDEYLSIVFKKPELITFVPKNIINYNFILTAADNNENVLFYIFSDKNLCEYVDEILLQIYLKTDVVRIDLIPEKFVTPVLIKGILIKNNDALNLVPIKNRTRMMYEVAADLGIKNPNMPKDLKDIVDHNKNIERNIKKYKDIQLEYEQNAKYILEYLSEYSIGLEDFCKKKKISFSKFKGILSNLQNFYPEIYEAYKKMTEIHKKESWGYVIRVIDFLKKGIKDGIKNPETGEMLPFNAFTYFLGTQLNPDLISKPLSTGLSRAEYSVFYKTIKYNTKDSLRDEQMFLGGVYIKNGKELTKYEKDRILNFLRINFIPVTNQTISYCVRLYFENKIDISKKYEKQIKYDVEEEQRNEIKDQVAMIELQEEVIKRIKEKIEELENQKKRVIL